MSGQLLALHAQRPRRRLTALRKLFWVALRTFWSGLTESQVFKDEVLAGAKSAHHPAKEISERSDHSWNHIGKLRIEVCAKSFILKVYEVWRGTG